MNNNPIVIVLAVLFALLWLPFAALMWLLWWPIYIPAAIVAVIIGLAISACVKEVK